jgi:membrane fusion protein, copper/silver efflux system
MNRKNLSRILIVGVPLLLAALLLGRLTAPRERGASGPDATTPKQAATEYTCSMHPQIRQPSPGKCPICAMDLIPVGRQNKEDTGPREISLTPHAKALARIQTSVVERRIPEAEVRLFGRVEADESRVRSITARFPARIERLYVNYTGVRVQAGDHLAKIYSPELLTAQAELFGAMRFNDARAIRAAREKLSLWGLSDAAIQAIERRGESSDTMDIDSPLGGFVTGRMVSEGDYVETGGVLFRIADLSTVWVILDAYEIDTPWLRYGQPLTFTTDALPGRSFEGRISFIPPVLEQATRTFRLRVNVPNGDLALRPGMFVTARVRARVAGEGLVIDPSWEGKWISPMHPEIVKDGPGQCDVCGMDLVPAADLGYKMTKDVEAPLVVPASAVLQTGRRAVVYVEVPDRDEPVYEGREIVLGPRAGDVFLVVSGLNEGERVVTNGAFKIDSSLQLLAKPSMMSAPETEAPPAIEASLEMKEALGGLLEAYFPVWRALAGDDLASARESASKLEASTHRHHGLPGDPIGSEFFERMLADLSKSAAGIASADDIGKARKVFEDASNALIRGVRTVGPPTGFTVHLAFCPMTFEGRRADWLQDDDALLNPYFGAAMLRCGEFEALNLPSAPAAAPQAPAVHRH